MDESYKIIEIVDSGDIPWDVIGGGISEYNEHKVGDDHGKNLCFVLTGPDEEIIGGVIGATYWDWLYVNLMWLKTEFRGHGYGKKMLAMAEEKARQRGATRAYLDTFSFQAPEFYVKQGYKIFGTLDNFPAGHQRYFLVKVL